TMPLITAFWLAAPAAKPNIQGDKNSSLPRIRLSASQARSFFHSICDLHQTRPMAAGLPFRAIGVSLGKFLERGLVPAKMAASWPLRGAQHAGVPARARPLRELNSP